MPTSGPKPSEEEIRIDKVVAWIAKRMAPSKIRHPDSSYTLKHYFEQDTVEYVTNDEFKTAMYRSGYMPLEGGNALNVHYKVKFRKNEEEGKR